LAKANRLFKNNEIEPYIMRTVIVTVIMGCCALGAKAQFTYDYLRAADNYYKKADYSSAAEYYEKYLSTNREAKAKTVAYNPYTAVATGADKKVKTPVSSRLQALYYTAESYRQLHTHDKAATYYEKVLAEGSADFPLARYYYAASLRALARYEEAEKEFNKFLDEYKTEDRFNEAAKKEVLGLRFIQTQLAKKDLKYYKIQKAAEPLNTKGANYAPAWLNDNTLLFTSTRVDSISGKKQGHINQVYTAVVTGGLTGDINKVALPNTGATHQGLVSLTPDGNTLFLTRWTIQNAKKTAALYSSQKTGNGWSDPALVDALVNVDGFNAQQPFVTADGKYLLYSSDRPGGFGGFDLWYAELDANGKPLRVANLGDAINTGSDEQAPFYHASSGSLVFSSNGRVGMGGYDFFYSKGFIDNWSQPLNFGHPVNSVKDDIYFVSRGSAKNLLEDVWLSSDRSAVCCLELFTLSKIQPVKTVQGRVVACSDQQPLEGVTVQIIDTINNKVVYTQTTKVDGNYSFTLDAYQPLKAVAAAEGYNTASLPFGVPADEDAESLTNPAICLAKDIPPVETAVVLEHVYYDYDSSSLKEGATEALDVLAAMMQAHPEITVELSAHTDNIGSDKYNQRLSLARAKSCVNYLVSKGIDKSRLKAKGYGATQPIELNQFADGSDNPEGRQKNRRTEFKILK
jgi:outer membrane protein OmpA-like peptidoglycan-associated protein/tetratricopeptide (TPR) repeat protein